MGKTGPTGNEQAQARQRKQEKREQELERLDLQTLMRQPEGRRVMARVLAFCRMRETILAVNESGHIDPVASLWKEGGRNVGLWLAGQLEDACPNDVVEMEKERVLGNQKDKFLEEQNDGISDGD